MLPRKRQLLSGFGLHFTWETRRRPFTAV